MKAHCNYKHENCSDVAINVLRIVHIPQKAGYKVKVSWINIVNPNNIYACGVTEEIFIKKEDIKNWKPFTG